MLLLYPVIPFRRKNIPRAAPGFRFWWFYISETEYSVINLPGGENNEIF